MNISIAVAVLSGHFLLALPVPLVDFGPVELQPPRNLSDSLRVPVRVFEVLALKYVLLLLGEPDASDPERIYPMAGKLR